VISDVIEEADLGSVLGTSPKRLDMVLRLFLLFKVLEDRSMANLRFIAYFFSPISVFSLTVLPKERDPLGIKS
jgi:hypothetical protein